MLLNYSKLRGRIKEKFGNEKNFSIALKISYSTLNKKLNNIYDFSQSEIALAKELLDISDKDLGIYFFCKKSCENTTI